MSCFRGTAQIFSKVAITEGHSLPGPLLHFVRGIKPRWLPKSKSKIFYVRTPTPIIPEEEAELRTAYFHYRTKLRAVRNFLVSQHVQKLMVMKEQAATEDRDNLAEFQAMEEQNDQWNSRVQAVREKGWLEEKARQEARTRQWEGRDERRMQRRLQRAQERLQQGLEDSKSFITLDNLDTEIEKLLNLRQDYNFAIDKQGNKISSDTTETPDNAGMVGSVEQQEPVKRKG